MKLLFCHNDSQVLHRLMERPLAGQNVVLACHHSSALIPLVASTEPHLIVIGGNELGATPGELEQNLVEAGFRTPIHIVPFARPSDQALDDIWQSLDTASREQFQVELDTQEYMVLTEEDFNRNDSGEVERRSRQEDRFLGLLAVGAMQHRKAQKYLAAAEASERHCELDWLAGVLDGNARAYLYRTQLFRYLSTLAHYVPGVDVECLPLPHPPSGRIDYLHTALSAEAYYALCAVRAFGINPQLAKAFWEAGQVQVSTDSQLAEDTARLAGWARLLREIATAHIDTLNACLAADREQITARRGIRRSQNQQKIFCQLWNFSERLFSPANLVRLTQEFHGGRRPAGICEFDSFFQFVRKIQQRCSAITAASEAQKSSKSAS